MNQLPSRLRLAWSDACERAFGKLAGGPRGTKHTHSVKTYAVSGRRPLHDLVASKLIYMVEDLANQLMNASCLMCTCAGPSGTICRAAL
jgi:hypothetical protein